jgi:hypothetical protein
MGALYAACYLVLVPTLKLLTADEERALASAVRGFLSRLRAPLPALARPLENRDLVP